MQHHSELILGDGLVHANGIQREGKSGTGDDLSGRNRSRLADGRFGPALAFLVPALTGFPKSSPVPDFPVHSLVRDAAACARSSAAAMSYYESLGSLWPRNSAKMGIEACSPLFALAVR